MRRKVEETAQEEDSMNTEKEPGQQELETAKYTIPEFCSSSQSIFGIGQDAVRVALMKGKQAEYTVSEAKELVKAYAERQVK